MRSWDNSMSRKAGEKLVGAGLGSEMFPVIKKWSDLVIEDVDDDTQDNNASYKHELMLLVGRAEGERGDAAAACHKGASVAADSSAPALNHFKLPTLLVFTTILVIL